MVASLTDRAMGWRPGGREMGATNIRSRRDTNVEETEEAVGKKHQVWWQSCVGTGHGDTK